MYNLYEMLQSGKTPDEIAESFTSELNEAIRQKEQEEKAADTKYQLADTLAGFINEFIEEYYPELKDGEDDGIAGEQIISLCDALAELQSKLEKLQMTLFNACEPVEETVEKAKDSISSVFDNFFKSNNI